MKRYRLFILITTIVLSCISCNNQKQWSTDDSKADSETDEIAITDLPVEFLGFPLNVVNVIYKRIVLNNPNNYPEWKKANNYGPYYSFNKEYEIIINGIKKNIFINYDFIGYYKQNGYISYNGVDYIMTGYPLGTTLDFKPKLKYFNEIALDKNNYDVINFKINQDENNPIFNQDEIEIIYDLYQNDCFYWLYNTLVDNYDELIQYVEF